jgi:hypothetical protein
MPSPAYLLALPERAIRSALGFSAGLLREIGEVALPRSVRRGQLSVLEVPCQSAFV